MTEKDFILVRNLTNFLKRYNPKDYEVFPSEGDEIEINLYSIKGEPEVWVGLDSYAVTFDDDSGFEQLTLDELMEKLETWEKNLSK